MLRITAREIVRHGLHVTSLDRVLMRRRAAQGMNIGHLALKDRRQVFGYVYDQGVWLNGRSEGARSGLGSELDATRVLRERLSTMLRPLGATEFIDIGCGEFTWMQHVDLGDVRYIGVDIVQSVIDFDRQRFGSGNRSFHCLDAVSEPLPRADVALCREVLFHLSFTDGRSLLANVRRAGIRHLIATTDRGTAFNADITTGDFRVINLQRRPYRFPVAEGWIPDDSVATGRGLGLWSVESLP